MSLLLLAAATVTLEGHQGPVFGVAFLGEDRVVTGSYDGTVRTWDRSGRELQSFALPEDANGVAVDGDVIYAACDDGNVYVIADPPAPLAGRHDNWAMRVATAGSRVVSCGRDGRAWIRGGGEPVEAIHGDVVLGVAVRRDGSQIALGGWDSRVSRWLADGAFAGEDRVDYPVNDVAYSPDGERLAAALDSGTIEVLGAPRGRLETHDGAVVALAWAGERIVAGLHSGRVFVFDAAAGTPVDSFDAHEGGVLGVAISADGAWIASGGLDGTAKLWAMP